MYEELCTRTFTLNLHIIKNLVEMEYILESSPTVGSELGVNQILTPSLIKYVTFGYLATSTKLRILHL